MGSPSYENGRDDDEKQHRVCLDQGFWLGQTEITQGQWQSVMGSNPSGFKDCGLNCPVEQVSFEDIQEFVKKLNHKHGGGFSLPTEAEWEYACRSGGKNETYCGGNDIDELAWYASNIDSQTYQVAQKEPNGLGLYDMSGNVYEWTCSDWNASYVGQETVCLNKTENSVRRSLRGGSWGSLPRWVRAANRSRNNTVYRYNYNGARLRFSRGG